MPSGCWWQVEHLDELVELDHEKLAAPREDLGEAAPEYTFEYRPGTGEPQ